MTRLYWYLRKGYPLDTSRVAYFVVFIILIGAEAISTGQLQDLSRELSGCLRKSYPGFSLGSTTPLTYPSYRVDGGFDSHVVPNGVTK